MKLKLPQLSRIEKIVLDNSPVMLAAAGVAGTVSTAVLAFKAGYEFKSIMEDLERLHIEEAARTDKPVNPIPPKEIIEASWKTLAPPFASGALTVSAIIGATRIGSRRAAGLAAAYTLAEHTHQEYKDKIKNTLGIDQDRKVRDEIAQDKVNALGDISGVIIGSTQVKFMDSKSGRVFPSDVESIRAAENSINKQVLENQYASLTDFYELIGLRKNGLSDEMGWTPESPLEISFSTTTSDDGREAVMYIDYELDITRGYWRAHH